MLQDIVLTLLGALLGLGSGYYFERRSSSAIRQENQELQDELSKIKAGVLTRRLELPPPLTSDLSQLPQLVLEWAKANQNSEGRLRYRLLCDHFAAEGAQPKDVESALELHAQQDRLEKQGPWLILK